MRWGVVPSFGNHFARFRGEAVSMRTTPFDPGFSHLDQVPPIFRANGIRFGDRLECAEPPVGVSGQFLEEQWDGRLTKTDDRAIRRMLRHRLESRTGVVARLPLLGESPEFSLRLGADFRGL